MPKICMIIPYFGKFKGFFPLFLYSASKNPFIDFHIFTQKENINETALQYSNIFYHEDSLECIKERAKTIFGYDVCLDNPYKLCDFKNFYNKLFKDIVKKYDYWGFCDTDMIFGDISKFITTEVVKDYYIIGKLGHLVIVRNDDELNSKYFNVVKSEAKIIFQSKYNYGFDENGFSYFNVFKDTFPCFDIDGYISDIRPQFRHLSRYQFTNKWSRPDFRGKQFYIYNDGNLLGYFLRDGKIIRQPFLYAHFQKRNMKMCHGIKYGIPILIKPNFFKRYNNTLDIDIKLFKRIIRINIREFIRAQFFWFTYYLKRMVNNKDDIYKHL